ncbi:MAG: YbjN domain-containing protein [Antricoccus sp.]
MSAIDPDRSKIADTIEKSLRDSEVDYQRLAEDHFAAELPGTRRLKTTCHLKVGEHSLQISAFVMRHPDENHEDLWAYLLMKNARAYLVSWAIDKVGDVYLTGRMPLSAVTGDEIDRLLGSVLQMADDGFNPMLEIGFASSMKREWEWRVKRGESLANLEAFRGFIEKMLEEDTDKQFTDGD